MLAIKSSGGAKYLQLNLFAFYTKPQRGGIVIMHKKNKSSPSCEMKWVCDHHPEAGSEEEKLIKVLENPIDWV
ncbi:hypothetical protein [Flavobacterium hungaricum]|uniref:hypothetical protein n=1 Tax=Flavobacterium hungaricum TaxID=2082725 RepID=UPI001883FC3D|nr:hypothetical protein [Flavobacterium hungaricum]